jgi:tetratricopeptide (TPR) repeat protein
MDFSTSYNTPKKLNVKKLLQMIEEEQRTNYVLYQDKIAQIYSKLSRPGLAIEKYADILDIWTDNPEIFHNIAFEFARLKDFEQSISFQQKAKEFDPINEEYLEMLKVYNLQLIKQQRLKSRILKKKLQKYAITCMKTAERFIRKRQLAEALEILHYGLAATARYYDLYGQTLFLNNIANVYSLQEDYDQALSSYNVAIEIAEKLQDDEVAYLIKKNIEDMESFKKGLFLQVKDQPTFMNFTSLMEKHWKRINRPSFDEDIKKLPPEVQKKLISYKKLLNEVMSEALPPKKKKK